MQRSYWTACRRASHWAFVVLLGMSALIAAPGWLHLGVPVRRRIYPQPLPLIVQLIARGSVEEVRAAVRARPSLMNEPVLGTSPISIALYLAKADVARVLMDAGADPNVGSVNAPLLVAVWQADARIVRDLLDRGANPFAHSQANLIRDAYGIWVAPPYFGKRVSAYDAAMIVGCNEVKEIMRGYKEGPLGRPRPAR